MNIEKRKKTEQTTNNKQIQKIQFHSNKKKKKKKRKFKRVYNMKTNLRVAVQITSKTKIDEV